MIRLKAGTKEGTTTMAAADKITGEDFTFDAKVTANDGTNATLTPLPGVMASAADVTTLVLNGAGKRVDVANGYRRYRVTIERIN